MEETNEVNTELAETQEARPTYWLTRFMILRLLGAIYAIAFLVAINQILPLISTVVNGKLLYYYIFVPTW